MYIYIYYNIYIYNLKKDIDLIEKVHRRATRMIAQLRHLPYEETSECRVNFNGKKEGKRDMIEVFSILNGFDNICHEHRLWSAHM